MCGAMRKAMNRGDVIINTPPKGNSTTLEIKNMLEQMHILVVCIILKWFIFATLKEMK